MTRRILFVAVSLCILAITAVLGTEHRALAADFTVNSTIDAVDALPGDGACATLAGRCTLRAAIQETNALPGADSIKVPSGSYVLGIPGALEDASLTGDLDITGDVTITGAGAARTIVDGSQLDRVIEIRGDAAAEIAGVTVQGGNEAGSLGAGGIGITFFGGSLTLDRSVVRNNTSAGFAGGIGSIGGPITVSDSAITGNHSGQNGGGIASTGPVTLIRTDVSNNVSERGIGGVACCGGGDVTVVDSTFSGNTSGGGQGGGALGLAGTTATVTNSTFRNNSTDGTEGGGAILAVPGVTLNISNSRIVGNSSASNGGGIYSEGTTTMSGSVISDNAANPDSGLGGGAYNAGAMTVTNSTVSGNTAFLLGGLGSVNALTVIETTISGNTVKGFAETFAGAGIGVLNGSVTVIDSVISGNSTPNGAPGGMGVLGDATVRGTTISDNSAGGVLFGGGLAHGNGTLDIANTTISGNSSAGFGGGMALGGATALTNVTISGNSAASDGGGIAATGKTSLNNVTVTNNTADSNGDGIGDGGGISTVADPVTISNTIIAGNIDLGGEQPDCNKNGLLVSQGYNLVQHTAGCPFVSSVGDITGQDPNLGRLANNGGTTRTHALLRGSPAIDAGNPATPSGAPTCEGTDQRGVSRPQDGNGDGLARCDIGAYERRAERVETDGVLELPVEFQVTNSNTSGAACPGDNGQYTVRAQLIGPESVIYGAGSRAITVYVHGFSSSEPNWAFKLVPGYDLPVEMAKLGHVSLNINRLGYSPSDHPPGLMSCMGTAADVLHQIVGQLKGAGAVLPDGERAGFSKVVIAGHDSGGTIVEVEAYSYKDIDGLFVTAFGDTGFSETVTEWSVGASQLCLQGGEPSDRGAPNYHHFPPMTDEEFANDEALLRRIFYNTDEAVFQAVRQAIATGSRQLNPCGDLPSVPGAVASNLARLHEVTVPVLYLLGDHDIAFTEDGGRRQGGLYSGSRDVTSVIMEETPHFWMWGRTAADARRMVSEWLCTRGFVSAGSACGSERNR